MSVPPTVVRRLALAPVVVLLEALLVLLSPLLLLVAALLSPIFGGGRPLRVMLVGLAFTARHMAAVVACFGLWVAAGFGTRMGRAGIQQAHYDLMRWFVSGVYDTIEGIARVRVRVFSSAEAGAMLSAHERPALVLARHAGEGDTLLVVNELLVRHRRHPHVVMHERLRLDPLIDLLGSRLSNRFVDPRGGDTERDIAEMAAEADADSALIIFPEGRNFSEAHRRRAIDRLVEAGHRAQAEQASAMRHVSAPRPGGALAAIVAAPEADVVFLAHVGFPTGLREVWRHLPEHQTIDIRLWHVPAGAIPDDRDAQIDWLYGWWATLDGWVAEQTALRGAESTGPSEPPRVYAPEDVADS